MDSDHVTVFDLQMTVETRKKMFALLPNEMLRKVMLKLDVQPLMTLRGVCQRWNAIIEHICNSKTSLVIKSKVNNTDIASYSKQFNGLVDFNENCAILTVKRYTIFDSDRDGLIKYYCVGLAKLFPSIVNVIIEPCYYQIGKFVESEDFPPLLKQWSASIVTLLLPHCFPHTQHPALFDRLDQLTGLKRLHFVGICRLPPSTLARLEHCSFPSQDIPDIAGHLSNNLKSLHLKSHATHNEIAQLVQLGDSAVKGLTHLSLVVQQHHEHRVVSVICDNFAVLRMLDISFRYEALYDFEDTIGQLSKLAQLSNLSLNGVNINMDYLARANLPTLNSVQTFSLARFVLQDDQGNGWIRGGFDLGLFCRALSTIMPNLVRLTIKHSHQPYRDGIAQNLHHFANLRVHEIAP